MTTEADTGVPGAQQLPSPLGQPVTLLQILLVFARIGMISFGGGISGWIYREVVHRRKWLTEDAFLSGLTLCQIVPGPNVVNLSVYIGQRLRGSVGSVVAILALLVPPMAVTLILGAVFDRYSELPWLHDLLEGIAAGAIGMTFSVGFRAAKHATARNRWSPLLLGAVFVAVGLLRWPMIPVVLVLGPAAVMLARWTRAR